MKYLNHNLLSRLGNLPLEARHSMTGNVSCLLYTSPSPRDS